MKQVVIEANPLPQVCQECKDVECDVCEIGMLRFPIIQLPEEEIELREDVVLVIG